MEKKRTTKGTKRTVFLYLLICLVLYGVIYLLPQVSDIFVETYTAEYATLETKTEAECLFVRDEKVYYASGGGSVERVISRGKLMRTRSHIVSVGSVAYYSDMRGVVSYYYDGLETVYTPENRTEIGAEAIENIQKSEENQMTQAVSETAESGDALFKIVDNQQWYLLCWIGEDEIDRFTEGSSITVDFLDGTDETDGSRVKMQVEQMISQGDVTMVVLSCNRYYKDFDKYRVKTCSLITSSTSGIVVETDSIVEEDGQQGVYVVDKYGNYNFTPVQILDQNQEFTVVEMNYFYDSDGNYVETINNYAEILRPQAQKE